MSFLAPYAIPPVRNPIDEGKTVENLTLAIVYTLSNRKASFRYLLQLARHTFYFKPHGFKTYFAYRFD